MTAHRYSPAPPFVSCSLHQFRWGPSPYTRLPPLGLLRPLRPTAWPSTDDASTRTRRPRLRATTREPRGGSHVHWSPSPTQAAHDSASSAFSAFVQRVIPRVLHHE